MQAKTHVTIPLEEFRKLLLITGLNERQRRELSGFVASLAGYGGVAAAARALGMSPITVRKGLAEFRELSEKEDAAAEKGAQDASDRPAAGRIRRRGGGRKSVVEKQPGLLEELERLLEAQAQEGAKRLSLRKLQRRLAEKGFTVSHTVVGELVDRLRRGR